MSKTRRSFAMHLIVVVLGLGGPLSLASFAAPPQDSADGDHENCCCKPAAEVLPPGCMTRCTAPPVTCNSTGTSTASPGKCQKQTDALCSDGGTTTINTYTYNCTGPSGVGCPTGKTKCKQERTGDPTSNTVANCTGTTCAGGGGGVIALCPIVVDPVDPEPH